jgi:ureidoacrylate peracid hydrolase
MHPIGPTRNAWRVNADRVELVREQREARPFTLATIRQEVVLDLNRTALVVIDMQNDFCAPGGWLDGIGVDIAPARQAIAPIAALTPLLRTAGVPVIWLNWGTRTDRANLPPNVVHVYNPDGVSIGIGDPLPGSGSPVLEKGGWSAHLVDGLTVEPEDIQVDKYRMSGFFDTELDSILRNLSTATILFAGVNMDQCVLATLSDAACMGYDCVLLSDCCATTSPPFCVEATLYNVAQCFGFVASSSGLVAGLSTPSPTR